MDFGYLFEAQSNLPDMPSSEANHTETSSIKNQDYHAHNVIVESEISELTKSESSETEL